MFPVLRQHRQEGEQQQGPEEGECVFDFGVVVEDGEDAEEEEHGVQFARDDAESEGDLEGDVAVVEGEGVEEEGGYYVTAGCETVGGLVGLFVGTRVGGWLGWTDTYRAAR